jgi:hypothetical protein
MEFVVDRVAVGQVFMHKYKREILPLETVVSTPLISIKSYDILSVGLECLNVDGQTDAWK